MHCCQDSGGLTSAGELPEAQPIWVDSARYLKSEIEKLVVALDEKQEWTKRIEVVNNAEIASASSATIRLRHCLWAASLWMQLSTLQGTGVCKDV